MQLMIAVLKQTNMFRERTAIELIKAAVCSAENEDCNDELDVTLAKEDSLFK